MQRVAFTMRIKEGQQEEYIRRHKAVWPEVLEEAKRAGVHKSSIFMNGLELFVYMEVDDYAEAVRILGESPNSLRWEEYMEPIVEAGPGEAYDPQNAYPDGLPEVWYWEAK